jgi:hypothetical protein
MLIVDLAFFGARFVALVIRCALPSHKRKNGLVALAK